MKFKEVDSVDLIGMMESEHIIDCTLCREAHTSNAGQSRESFAREIQEKKGWKAVLVGDENHICCLSCVKQLILDEYDES